LRSAAHCEQLAKLHAAFALKVGYLPLADFQPLTMLELERSLV